MVSAHQIPIWNFANTLSNMLINLVRNLSSYIRGEKYKHTCGGENENRLCNSSNAEGLLACVLEIQFKD